MLLINTILQEMGLNFKSIYAQSAKNGVTDRHWTRSLNFTKVVLYQLSYCDIRWEKLDSNQWREAYETSVLPLNYSPKGGKLWSRPTSYLHKTIGLANRENPWFFNFPKAEDNVIETFPAFNRKHTFQECLSTKLATFHWSTMKKLNLLPSAPNGMCSHKTPMMDKN